MSIKLKTERLAREAADAERAMVDINRSHADLPRVSFSRGVCQVESNADGGGHYNCHLQELKAKDDEGTEIWNTNNNPFADKGETEVVLNISEAGTTGHVLSVGTYLYTWKQADTEGTLRRLGVAASGGGGSVSWAMVQSVHDMHFTCNLLNDDLTVKQENVSVYVFMHGLYSVDNYLSHKTIPRIEAPYIVPVVQVASVWYLMQTLTHVGEDKSIRWASQDSGMDEPLRAAGFFRE